MVTRIEGVSKMRHKRANCRPGTLIGSLEPGTFGYAPLAVLRFDKDGREHLKSDAQLSIAHTKEHCLAVSCGRDRRLAFCFVPGDEVVFQPTPARPNDRLARNETPLALMDIFFDTTRPLC